MFGFGSKVVTPAFTTFAAANPLAATAITAATAVGAGALTYKAVCVLWPSPADRLDNQAIRDRKVKGWRQRDLSFAPQSEEAKAAAQVDAEAKSAADVAVAKAEDVRLGKHSMAFGQALVEALRPEPIRKSPSVTHNPAAEPVTA